MSLDLISVDQRSVVELTYFSGYSYQEIADIMKVSESSVKTWIHRARIHLRKTLQEYRK